MFTHRERKYCFSFRSAAPHLAGIFAAKEAAVKAFGHRQLVMVLKLEIRRNGWGAPEVWRQGKRVKKMAVSITHTVQLAAAVAVAW